MEDLITAGGLLLEKYEKDKRAGRGQLSDVKSSVEKYSEAIDRDTREADVFGSRAAAYNWLGEYDKAFADICRAIELEPSNGVYLFNRGIAYAEKENWENAFYDFFKAVKTYSPQDEMSSELFRIKSAVKNIYRYRFKKILNDNFYHFLQKFSAEYGKDIYGKETFRPLLLDFSKGEYKNDIKLILRILKQNLLEEIKKCENPEAARKRVHQLCKEDAERIIDILCCLLFYDVFFLMFD